MNTKASTICNFLTKYRTAVMIAVIFLMTVFLQANASLASLSHETKTTLYAVLLMAFLALAFFMAKSGRLTTDDLIFLLITGGVLLRSYYVICTGVTDRQHDEGYFSGLSDDLINPGHLGYIEYLCKFGHLPDFSPYKLFRITIRRCTTSWHVCLSICRCSSVSVTVLPLKTSRHLRYYILLCA